jgi:tetratricopeptide (TPR) repeat protein
VSQRARLGAGAAAVVVVAAVVTLHVLRPDAEPRTDSPPAETTDAVEARLLQEAAQSPADPRPHRELGDHFVREHRPFSALWQYQAALSRQPGDVETRHSLARTAASAGHVRYALPEFARLLETRGLSPSTRRDIARSLAVLYLRTMQPARAVATLTPLRTDSPEVDLAVAQAERVAGAFQRAEAAYERALREDPTNRNALLGLAQLYMEWDRPDAAIRLLTGAGDRGLLDGKLWLWLERAYARRTDGLDRAVACLSQAMDLMPNEAAAYYDAGLLLERKGDLVAAVDRFTQAVRLDRRYAEAHLALSRVLRSLGLTRRARHALAEYYSLRGQPDRVIAALSMDGASPIAEAETAQRAVLAYTQMQLSQRAVQLSDAAIREHPDSRSLLYQGMLIQMQAGSREKLEAMCRQMEQKYPRSGDPAWFRGRLAVAAADTAGAIRHFEAAVAAEPERSSFHASLGGAYAAIPTPENLQRAVPELQRAVALNPRDAGARQRLGDLLARTGRLKEAEEQLLRALDLAPANVAAMNSLLQFCSTPDRAGHAALLGGLARMVRDAERELQVLRRQCRDRPDDRAARSALARALGRAGRPLEARDHWERAAEGNAPPDLKAAFAASERLIAVLRG